MQSHGDPRWPSVTNATIDNIQIVGVADPNHAPIASDIVGSASEDTGNPVTLAASYTDPDSSDTFVFNIDTTTTAGKVTNNNDGTFTYDPNGKFEYLGVGETATDTFTYTVTDNHGASSTATATVTIHGENDAPVASPDLVIFQKGTTVRADAAHGVLANDHDPDVHDVLAVSAVNGSNALIGHAIKGTYGSLTLSADGSYTYVAKSNVPVGAQDVFQYSISDGHGGTASSSLTFGVPYPALVISAASLVGTVNERSLVTGSSAIDQASGAITFNVPDVSNRPTATLDLTDQTISWQDGTHDYSSQLTHEQIVALGSAFAITQTGGASSGTVKWAYKINDSGLDFLGANETITVTTPIVIDDHHGNVVTENVVVTIAGADDRPSVSGSIVLAATEDDAPFTVDLLQLAFDPDAHDTIHVDAVSGLTKGVTLVADTLHVDPGAYGSLSAGNHATINVKYDVVDGNGGLRPTAAEITILGVNDPPTARPDESTVLVGNTARGNVLLNDSDPDTHDSLGVTTVSFDGLMTSLSAGHAATIKGHYGTLTLRSDGSYAYSENQTIIPSHGDSDVFTYVVTDRSDASASATLTLAIPSPINNVVVLTDGLVPVEMIKLAVDSYPFGNSGYHPFDPFGTPLSLTNPSAVSDILNDNWHLVSSAELHLGSSVAPSKTPFTFDNGLYQATTSGELLNFDPPEADALVLTGIVDGKRTLAISFAGTDQKSDWLDYANFQNHYAKFAPLVTAVKNFIDAGAVDQVLVSGHSLGGAMVQDFVEDPIFAGDPHFNVRAWTIGSPGSDNVAGSNDDPRITNFYHALDPVFQAPAFSEALANQSILPSALQVAERDLLVAAIPDLLTDQLHFTAAEASTVSNVLINQMASKTHQGTDVEVPFGEAIIPGHLVHVPLFDTNVDFDAHDATGYLRDVAAFLLHTNYLLN